MFTGLVKLAKSSKLDLPILRRIADPSEGLWPPMHIHVFPTSKFDPEFLVSSNNSRFWYEDNLPQLIKESKVYTSKQENADLFLVPCPLSNMSLQTFSNLIERVRELDDQYDEYHGANFIFLHAQYPGDRTAINTNNLLLHPGHIFTSGFAVDGPYVKTWVHAKNMLLPLKPFTKEIAVGSAKKHQIAVDISEDKCLPRNVQIRRNIYSKLSGKPGFVFESDPEKARKLMEESEYTLVTACEMPMASQYYDAVNAMSIPIVLNNLMRFPFEGELIDYTKFIIHIDEDKPEDVIGIMDKVGKHLPKMQMAMDDARQMYRPIPGDGGYVWAITWSLYMKLLAWLPIRRTRILDNIFREPSVFVAT